MSSTKSYLFTDSDNYTLSDAAKIEVADGYLRPILVDFPGQVFSEDFADDTDFTYDNTKAEFSAGVVEQKDQTPAAAQVSSDFTGTTNANWNKLGSETATLNGSPTLSAGKLVCSGSQGLYYDLSANSGVGAYKVIYTPNYTGGPVANVNICSINESSGNANRIILSHSPSGNTLRVTINDSSGTVVIPTTAMGANPNFSTGTDYELELNWDNVGGVVRLFLDGTLHATNSPGAWTHGTGACRFTVGATANIYNNADGSFDQPIYFNAVQHTTTYTPGYTLDPYLYVESKVQLPTFTAGGAPEGSMQSVQDFTETKTGTVQWTVGIDIAQFYWNGSAWVVSDETFAQSNTATVLVTNLPSLEFGEEQDVVVKLYFTETNTQSNVDYVEVEYTSQIFADDDPYADTDETFSTDDLLTFTEDKTVTASDMVKYAVSVDGQLKWNNSGTVENSDGTYAQANTAAEITAKIGDFASDTNTVGLRCFVHADDGVTQPLLDSIIITYDPAIPAPTLPTLTNLEGFFYGHKAAWASELIQVRPYYQGLDNGDIWNVYEWEDLGTTTAAGKLQADIFVQPDGQYWELKTATKRYKFQLTDKALNNWNSTDVTKELIEDDE